MVVAAEALEEALELVRVLVGFLPFKWLENAFFDGSPRLVCVFDRR
jgi:hypothetical protein